MKHFVLYIVVLGLLATTLLFPEAVMACSGYLEPGDLQENINNADIVVMATVIETDDAQNNAVLEVQKHLAGGLDTRYIVLYYVDPDLAAVYRKSYDTGCLYGGGGYDNIPSPRVGMSGYFVLTRLDNGAYEYVSNAGPSYIVPEEPGAFEALVTEVRNEPKTIPVPDRMPPLNPLLITTSSGHQYMLPIDGGPLVPYTPGEILYDRDPNSYTDIFSPVPACTEIGCRMYTPDHSLFGDIGENNIISFDYPYSSASSSVEGFSPIEIEGKAFSFSPTGQALVVWNDSQMKVYRVSTTYCNCETLITVPYLSLAADITLINDYQNILTHPWEMIRWSTDGSTLAYSDLVGLWLIDVFRDGEPERLVRNSAGVMPLPLFVSHTGRYVGYTFDPESPTWTTVDRTGGDIFSNALPSPNELYMAYFAERDGTFASHSEIVGGQCYPLPCSTLQRPYPDEFLWIEQSGTTYALSVRCGDDRISSPYNDDSNCSLQAPVFSHRGVESYRQLFSDGVDFVGAIAYEPQRGFLAYVTGPHTLKIFPAEYDLSDQIEGTIVDIAWLPSLFFYYP